MVGVGTVVEARYRLVGRLGRGACGEVFEARSLGRAIGTHGRRRVAVKVLTSDDRDSRARFTHEAFLGMRLEHEGLAKVLDFGKLADGRPYFVMELGRGEPLDKLLSKGKPGRPLDPALCADLIEETAIALFALHQSGVVHRDVKPSNLLVELRRKKPPRIRLLDLGVAGIFDRRRASRLGAVDDGATGSHGTPAYIAPEQALGHPVDPRADIYALACVAYRLLTGVDAFRGASATATVRAHLFDDAVPPTTRNPALPAAVDAVLAHALEKAPSDRTPSVIRFAAELRAALRA
jgi:serine/threonine protein kinase